MAEKLEDLNLPNASVQKIIKEALPDSVNVGKDARSALSRAASVFVLYITSQASKEAQKVNRKTLTGNDVLKALTESEFEEFVEPLEELLQGFKNSKKKPSPKDKKAENGEAAPENDDHEDDIEEIIDDGE